MRVTSGPTGARRTTSSRAATSPGSCCSAPPTAPTARLARDLPRDVARALRRGRRRRQRRASCTARTCVKSARRTPRSTPTTRAAARSADRRPRGLRPAGRLDRPRRRPVHAHTWSDINDDNVAQPSRGDAARARARLRLSVHAVHARRAATARRRTPCGWDPAADRSSWQTNREQNGRAGLLPGHRASTTTSPPRRSAFNDASGNFEGRHGGDDPVLTQTDRRRRHRRRRRPGRRPRRTTRTWTRRPTASRRRCRCTCSRTPDAARRDFRNMNGGDDSGVVWHEYTHGLSNRLVVDARRRRARSAAPQAGAMGEAWSDWYASDLQVRDGLEDRRPRHAAARSTSASTSDLEPHVTPHPGARLPGRRGRRPALPRRRGHRPRRLHARRLRQDRRRARGPRRRRDLGPRRCGTCARRSGHARQRRPTAPTSPRSLVSDGMRLSPPEPSHARHAQRDPDGRQLDFGGALHDLIWDVFANRGMGYYAVGRRRRGHAPGRGLPPPPDPTPRRARSPAA